MKIYDLVKQLLNDYPELRDSDKKLTCHVWGELDMVYNIDHKEIIYLEDFMHAPSTETIRRCRQMIQAKYPELRGSKKIQEARAEKEKTKSTFVYREEVTPAEVDAENPRLF